MEREAAEQERIAAEMAKSGAGAQTTGQPSVSATTGTPTVGGTAAAPKAVDTAKRIVIDAPLVRGSFSLRGARLDDVIFTGYKESLDDDSDNIHFLQKTSSDMPFFAGFGWISDNPDQPMPDKDTFWNSDQDVLSPSSPVTLFWDNGNGLRFKRRISINEDYLFTIDDTVVSSLGSDVVMQPFGFLRRHGTPKVSDFFILYEGPHGYFAQGEHKISYQDLKDEPLRQFNASDSGGWISFNDKYWLAALMPNQNVKQTYNYKEIGSDGDIYQMEFVQQLGIKLAAGETINNSTRLFVGAKKLSILDKYTEQLGVPHLDLTIDFGVLYLITKPFFYAINWLFELFGNFGLAVLGFTVIVKLVFFPLANKSYRSMAKMRLLAPKLQTLRERFGDDRMKLNQEMMALYKAEQVNPAAGCLPVLLQIPVFFALYKVLFVTIEMRHAPFFGWIADLSAPDPTSIFNLFGLLPYSVSFLPPFLQLGVWPILMGISMFLQMRLNPAPPDPIQAKVFQFMPIFFTFLLATFPAGLVIYWTWNNLLSMAQQWYIMKRVARG